MLIFYFMTKFFVVGNVLDTERNGMNKDLTRAVNAIAYDLSTLENWTVDWAAWDDTYNFVQDIDTEQYVEKNLIDATFLSQRVSMILFLNDEGMLKHAKWFDISLGQEVEAPADFQQELLQWPGLRQLSHADSVRKGLVQSPQGPMLIVAKPVVDSLKLLPSRGVLIVGRYLNHSEMELLAAVTNLRTDISIIDGKSSSNAINISTKAFLKDAAQIWTNDDAIFGMVAVKDIFGVDKFQLVIQDPRNYYKQSFKMLRGFSTAVFLTMALFGLAIFILIDRHVLRGLISLTKDISKIKGFEDVTTDFGVKGDDEVALLSKKLKDMFDELKASHDSLHFLSNHDALTGLYNRTYFEHYLQKLAAKPEVDVGVIVCDVDGLKLANDVAGHAYGDGQLKGLAEVLHKSCPEHAVLFRVGGDEFIIVIEAVTEDELSSICQNIRQNIEDIQREKRHNIVPLSVSVGYTISNGQNSTLDEMIKKADTLMYREKLLCNQSRRNGLVQTLKSALEARDHLTEGHAHRMAKLAVALARYTGISIHRLPDLHLFAEFHDVGKIGISDTILHKKGPLTPEQRIEMQKHCEVGFRIAQSTPDLAPIADLILKHHEWWDGTGYPAGLSGEDIPEECRMLAIADAFDAMTNNRPYRKAMTTEQAVEELRRYAGTQFDPILIKKFIEVLKAEGLYSS